MWSVVEKFGIQTEKGKVIWAYQNGDKHHKGVKLVIHAKKYKTLDQLKVQMSSQLALPTGPVQRIYAFHSLAEKPVEVKNLADFVDGGEYVVCGPEKFNKEASTSHSHGTQKERELIAWCVIISSYHIVGARW